MIDILRTRTHFHHTALHQHSLLGGLGHATLTGAEFDHILLAFDAYYSAAEAARVPLSHDLPDAPVTKWLSQDLAQRHLSSIRGTLGFTHPPIDTLSKLVGYLYTKQGSTLGGRVISKHLRVALELVPGVDQWFFAGYGEENGAQWKRFIERVEAMRGDLDADEVLDAAQGAFENISQVCDQVLGLRHTDAA